jgi:hypothetical protein
MRPFCDLLRSKPSFPFIFLGLSHVFITSLISSFLLDFFSQDLVPFLIFHMVTIDMLAVFFNPGLSGTSCLSGVHKSTFPRDPMYAWCF